MNIGYIIIEWDLVQDKMSNVYARVYLDKNEAEKQRDFMKSLFSWLDYRIGTMIIQ